MWAGFLVGGSQLSIEGEVSRFIATVSGPRSMVPRSKSSLKPNIGALKNRNRVLGPIIL